MKSTCVIPLFAALLLSVAGCRGTSTAETTPANGDALAGRLSLTGSSTVAPLVTEIAKRYEQLHPQVRIDVQTGGTGKGITDTRIGTADIGMGSRPLKADEADLVPYQIAADGVGLIVHAENPIRELTAEQIIDIYTDKIQNWKEVGGEDQPITVVHKAEGRATLEVFLQHFAIDNPTIQADVIVGENQHAIKTVAGGKWAIGYVSIGTAEADIEAGVPIRLLPLDGVAASTPNVASGEFPMSRPLSLITTRSPAALAKSFIEYCQSAEVHDLVKSQYFVPVASETDAQK
ncbi:ABC transporter substrate-binding protein [Blastopirellula marina]|uniref:ABC transporter substrate-binding protein n=1 Tax=Blastopirellula marina TaxID=124 RepID=A0A2S8EZC9_9BACT|nr:MULTISPECIES: phosphate ABC transporter substrate-binding protein [Pirellulaceae]PQO25286.1 ABC transporter substrate-binding protein [Blastopirellula marina]RCS41719.1 phosphate ABC transporter substrate-binding protein [Bremerella cremea]